MSWTYVGTVGPVSRYEKRDGKWYFVCDELMTEVTNAKSVAKLEHDQKMWDEICADIDQYLEENVYKVGKKGK